MGVVVDELMPDGGWEPPVHDAPPPGDDSPYDILRQVVEAEVAEARQWCRLRGCHCEDARRADRLDRALYLAAGGGK